MQCFQTHVIRDPNSQRLQRWSLCGAACGSKYRNLYKLGGKHPAQGHEKSLQKSVMRVVCCCMLWGCLLQIKQVAHPWKNTGSGETEEAWVHSLCIFQQSKLCLYCAKLWNKKRSRQSAWTGFWPPWCISTSNNPVFNVMVSKARRERIMFELLTKIK